LEDKIRHSFEKLKTYCESRDFKGWDPYDGLNSKLFQALPFMKNNAFFRLAWIQFFKRSPLNFRKVAGVDLGLNPKGCALFLSAYCNLYRMDPSDQHLIKINQLIGYLRNMESSGYSGACWGYNFDWQARAFYQPKQTPTVVASTYIGNSLLDAYDILQDETLLSQAVSVSDFILKDLNRTYDQQNNFCFSYSPLDHTSVFNASLLASRMLARIYHYNGDESLLSPAKSSVDFCVAYQQSDGSWSYSPLPYHQWIDSFHTGFNLECISDYQRFTGDQSYQETIRKGLDYYLSTFFTDEGVPKYYHNSVYPIDIHAPAQLIVTLSKAGRFHENLKLINNVLNWTIDHMQFPGDGYFYYQKHRYFTNKIPYIRWSQAWMFYAMTEYLKNHNQSAG